MPEDTATIICTRRNKKLQDKTDIFNLVYDSYKGGKHYTDGNHLWNISTKESSQDFELRKERAIYINIIKPIISLLSAKLYSREVKRNFPPSLDYVKENVGNGKSISKFMQDFAILSGLMTMGVLIDSPSEQELIDKQILTKKDAVESGKHPYVKRYFPWQIRDFYFDEMGKLEWVILDDTFYNAVNPFEKPEKQERYTLWTKTEFKRYRRVKDSDNPKKAVYELEIEGKHPVGYVPFNMKSWEDSDDDNISDTSFEDAAIIARQIYNVMSYLDEMIAAGTFKHLFYPAPGPEKIPQEFLMNGTSGAMVTFFNGQFGQPFYAGADLQSVAPFIQAIEYYSAKIYEIFGQDQDRDKKYIQSGVAKELEFSKSETMLKSAAHTLEELEEWILITMSKYHTDITDSERGEIEVEYQKEYQSEDIDAKLAQLFQITTTPFDSLNKESWAEIVKVILAKTDNAKMKKILSEIYQASEGGPSGTESDKNTLPEGDTEGIT